MPDNVFRRMAGEARIIKDARPLEPDFLPDALPHRDDEIKEIAYALRAAAEGQRPENLFVHGPPGSGKTSCARYVLAQLREYSQRAIPVYVNCWEFSTRHSVLALISESMHIVAPRRGVAADELLARIAELLRKERKIPIVVLDELDRLFAAGEDAVLYDLLRAGEVFSAQFGVIAITNDATLLARMDRRVRSSFAAHELEFRAYTAQQLGDVLSERAALAFYDGAYEQGAIALCAASAAKHGGDARAAIETLRRAARAAERENAAKLLEAHVRAALEAQQQGSKPLAQGEQLVLEILRERGEMGSAELYAEYSLRSGGSDRAVRNHLKRLEALGLVETSETRIGQGKSRAIKLTT
jgi:cell division control protein 6